MEKQLYSWALGDLGFKCEQVLRPEDLDKIACGILKPAWENLLRHYHARARDVRLQLKLFHYQQSVENQRETNELSSKNNINVQNFILLRKSKQLSASIEHQKALIDDYLKGNTQGCSSQMEKIEMLCKDMVILKDMVGYLKIQKMEVAKLKNQLSEVISHCLNSSSYNSQQKQGLDYIPILECIQKLKELIRGSNFDGENFCDDLSKFESTDLESILLQLKSKQAPISYGNSSMRMKQGNIFHQKLKERHVECVERHFVELELSIQVAEKEKALFNQMEILKKLVEEQDQHKLENLKLMLFKFSKQQCLRDELRKLTNFNALSKLEQTKREFEEKLFQINKHQAQEAALIAHLQSMSKLQLCSLQSLLLQPDLLSEKCSSYVRHLEGLALLELLHSFPGDMFSKSSKTPIPLLSRNSFSEFPLMKIALSLDHHYLPIHYRVATSLGDYQPLVRQVVDIVHTILPQDLNVLSSWIQQFLNDNHALYKNIACKAESICTSLCAKEKLLGRVQFFINNWAKQPAQHCVPQMFEDNSFNELLYMLAKMRSISDKVALK